MSEEQTRLTRILLDALPCVALLLRPGSREIVASNEAAVKCGAIPGGHCYDTWGRRRDPCPWCLAPKAWASSRRQRLEVEALGVIWDAHWIPVSDDLYVHYAFDITERRKAEEALRKSENRFATFFKASPVGISFSRLGDKRILEVNDRWQKITGYDRREAIGRTPTELNLWADLDARKRLVEELSGQGALRDFEVQVRQKSGNIIRVLISVAQVELEGEPCLLSMALDITERQRAEKALRESEARFHEIFENMAEGLAIYQATDEGADFLFRDINPAGARNGKVERHEIIGRSVQEVFPGIKEMGLLEVFQEVYRTGKPQRHPVSCYRDDRIFLWVENYVFKLPSGEIVTVYNDLTENKKVQEKLGESEKQYRYLVEAASEGICRVDENFIITYVNPQMAEMLGYGPEEMVGRPIGNFMFPEDQADHERKKEDRRKGVRKKIERRLRHKDGSPVWTIVSPKPFIDDDGNFKGSFATFTDITQRKKTESALLEKQQQLQVMAIRMSEVEELERKDISGTLHDLVGQNLTALNLNLNIAITMLPEKMFSVILHRLEEAQKLAEEIAGHIREVMSELRPSVLDDFGLVAALHWYGERVRALTGLRITIEGKEFHPRLPSIMETIIFRIAQEALTNVSKHAGADQVDIALGKRSGKAQLTITDNGCGFVFKGFRLGGEKRGWGLATMKERAAALGGDLEVLSEPGKGTRIILQLPVER